MSVLKEPSTTTMNRDDNSAEVIYLSSSASSPRSLPRQFVKKPSSSSSEVVVITDTEDDDAVGRHSNWRSPARRVLSDAQLNLPMAPGPSVHVDPFITYSARVLEIIPDVEPTHLRTLLEQHYPASGDGVVQNVLHVLFEDASYPRVEKVAGKRKRAPDDDDGREKSKLKLDYASKDRKFTGGQSYPDLAISQLLQDFPLIPKPHIRATLKIHGGLYAPTQCVSRCFFIGPEIHGYTVCFWLKKLFLIVFLISQKRFLPELPERAGSGMTLNSIKSAPGLWNIWCRKTR